MTAFTIIPAAPGEIMRTFFVDADETFRHQDERIIAWRVPRDGTGYPHPISPSGVHLGTFDAPGWLTIVRGAKGWVEVGNDFTYHTDAQVEAVLRNRIADAARRDAP